MVLTLPVVENITFQFEERPPGFLRRWGALVIIFRELGSKLIVLGIYGALQKSFKKSHLKGKAFFLFDFLKKKIFGFWGEATPTPLFNLNVFTFVVTCYSRLVLVTDKANNFYYYPQTPTLL